MVTAHLDDAAPASMNEGTMQRLKAKAKNRVTFLFGYVFGYFQALPGACGQQQPKEILPAAINRCLNFEETVKSGL